MTYRTCILVPAVLLQSGIALSDQQSSDKLPTQPPLKFADRPVVIPAAPTQPHWYPLGPEVYHASDVEAAQKKILSFRREPRWFLVDHKKSPFPKSLNDVPKSPHGSSLQLAVSPSGQTTDLDVQLTLTAGKRALLRQKEHRWINAIPFLFAFFSNGRPVQTTDFDGFTKFGGATWCHFVVRESKQKKWMLKVDGNSVFELLGNREPQEVGVVAAFSECQHEPYWVGRNTGPPSMKIVGADGTEWVPHVIVRSDMVRIKWTGDKWGQTD